MPASHKYTRKKAFSNSKQAYFRTFLKSYFFESSLFSYYKKGKKIDSKGNGSFPLINKIKKNIIIEWEKGEKKIYIIGNFSYSYNYLLSNKITLNKRESCLKSNKQKDNSSTKESSFFTLDNNVTKKNIDFSFSKKNYCNYYPKLNEMKEKAAKKPFHFPMECFHGVNQFHKKIGSKEYLILDENNTFNSKNESYKVIDKKDHIFLNHLIKKTSKINSNNSVTIRYRCKNTTFIYYK